MFLQIILLTLAVQGQDHQSIDQYHTTFQLKDDSIFGNGWGQLINGIGNSHAVFIGEDHGLSEIPIIVKHLSDELKNRGFNTYLGEVGPFSMQSLLKSLQENLQYEFLRKYRFSVPFLHWDEELDLVEHLYKQEFHIYGIDQEFVTSTILHLESLLDSINNIDDKAKLQFMIKRENEALNKLLRQGNYLDLMMVSGVPEDFNELEDIAHSVHSKLRVGELKKSFKIYRSMLNGHGIEANDMRQALMKVHYDKIDLNHASRIIVKLGAIHCFRNDSPSQVEELGEYVSKKDSSFHLLVLGKQGTVNNYTIQSGFNEKLKQANYDISKRFPIDLSQFLEYVSEGEWSYFDLKSIRESNIMYSSEVNRLARSFDGMILISKVSAATNIE